jgi:hypothetical protein
VDRERRVGTASSAVKLQRSIARNTRYMATNVMEISAKVGLKK